MALRQRSKRSLLLVAGTAALLAGVAFGQSSADAACYYSGGDCTAGNLAANTWTPWTGYYTASRSWLMPTSVVNSAWLQIKLTDGTVGGWQSGGSVVIIYAVSYTSRSVGHRCQHGGPFTQSVKCGFNDNP